jgi:hypothetical protein
LTIARTVVPQGPTLHLSRDAPLAHRRLLAGTSPAAAVARSVAMVVFAAFAILILLPAAIAAAT